jgi:hypothetical protein
MLGAPRGKLDGPAKAGPGQIFVQEGERESEHFKNIGDPLDLALARNQITQALWDVGDLFRKTFAMLGASGKDSTQALMSPGGSSDGAAAWSQGMVDAAKVMKGIQDKMPARSYRIVRYFCGEGMPMGEAVARVTSIHPSTVKYRVVEALEDLEDALESLPPELRAMVSRTRRAA